jgi:hypothetical protein
MIDEDGAADDQVLQYQEDRGPDTGCSMYSCTARSYLANPVSIWDLVAGIAGEDVLVVLAHGHTEDRGVRREEGDKELGRKVVNTPSPDTLPWRVVHRGLGRALPGE